MKNKVIDVGRVKFIIPKDATAGKRYSLIKTLNGNPARIITSGCNTAEENLSIFVEKVLYKIAELIPSCIKDTCHMLQIIK